MENAYGLRGVKHARIALNTTFAHTIRLRNPLDRALEVVEVYTSDDDLHVDLPPAGKRMEPAPNATKRLWVCASVREEAGEDRDTHCVCAARGEVACA